MLAVALLFTTFERTLSENATFVFIDNNDVLGALMKGGTTTPEANTIADRLWLDAAMRSFLKPARRTHAHHRKGEYHKFQLPHCGNIKRRRLNSH